MTRPPTAHLWPAAAALRPLAACGPADTDQIQKDPASSDGTCVVLADGHVEVGATGIGAFRYDTSIGGSDTVPAFRIEKVEIVRKA